MATQDLFSMEISLDEKASFNQVLIPELTSCSVPTLLCSTLRYPHKEGVAADICHLLSATL